MTSIKCHMQRRFCSNIGMNNQAVKAAQEAVQKSEQFDIRYFWFVASFPIRFSIFKMAKIILTV